MLTALLGEWGNAVSDQQKDKKKHTRQLDFENGYSCFTCKGANGHNAVKKWLKSTEENLGVNLISSLVSF